MPCAGAKLMLTRFPQSVEAQLTEMKSELDDARALRREVDGVGDFSLILEADRAVTELEVSACRV